MRPHRSVLQCRIRPRHSVEHRERSRMAARKRTDTYEEHLPEVRESPMSVAIAKQVRRLPVLLPTGKPVNASMSKTDLLLLCQWWASPRTARPKELGDKI